MLNKPVSCDMMLFPSRPQRSRVRCQKFTKFVQKQVICSKQELVNQKRGLLYARLLKMYIARDKNAPTLTESKQKAGGTFPWQS
jgi:hypothetical protein